jgi:hypothetical protein
MMNRAELIAELKRLLDDGSVEALTKVIELAREYNTVHPDVCDRARLARERIVAGGPVDRAEADRWAAERVQAKRQEKMQKLAAGAGRTVLRDGFFTVVDGEGHITFKIERQAVDATFAAGETIISRLHGPNNTGDYHGVAFAKADGRVITWKKFRDDARLNNAIAVLSRDPKAAALGYAKQSGRCYICGRVLTEPSSIEAGVGPYCRSKGF